MRPPTITITPSSNTANVGPDVSSVALVRACTRAPASEPAMASASTIGAKRPISMARPSVTSYHAVLADSPAKADPSTAYPDKCVHPRMDPAMTSGAPPGLKDRPDLIAHALLQGATESPTAGGKLRTYLGIAPGVGKTYAMLRDGRAVRRAGVDAVVAYRERHGRPATAAQLGDLEGLPAPP